MTSHRLITLCLVTSAFSLFAGNIETSPPVGTSLEMAAPETVGVSSERLERLTQGMQNLIDEGKLAGMVTLVARQGKIVQFKSYGHLDKETGTSMRNDAIFRIFSMSKPIIGAALMTLYEEGKFSLSDPIERYIPELKGLKVLVSGSGNDAVYEDPKHPPTIRELLTHTAGFSYGFNPQDPVDKLYREAEVLKRSDTLNEMIAKIAKLPLRHQPGTTWHYSVAVDIQGYLIEVLSGKPLDLFLKERLFDPLHMNDTGFFVPKEKADRLAQIYKYDEKGSLSPGWQFQGDVYDPLVPPALLSGGGGLLSTAFDYLRFCQMMLNGGELDGVRILSPVTVRFMLENQLPKEAQKGYLSLDPRNPTNGLGFNLGFALVINSVESEFPSVGSYMWGGAAGTWFWIDPVEDLIFIGMIQQAPDEKGLRPDVRTLSRRLVYPAITALAE